MQKNRSISERDLTIYTYSRRLFIYFIFQSKIGLMKKGGLVVTTENHANDRKRQLTSWSRGFLYRKARKGFKRIPSSKSNLARTLKTAM